MAAPAVPHAVTHAVPTAAQRDASRLLLLESSPQHFDTPAGLYTLPASRNACVPLAQPVHAAADWRNEGMRRGLRQALNEGAREEADAAPGRTRGASARCAHADTSRRVQLVRTWRALSRLSGVDVHARHVRNPLAQHIPQHRLHNTMHNASVTADAAVGLAVDHDERIAMGTFDCTHLSPDALLFVTQALTAAIRAESPAPDHSK